MKYRAPDYERKLSCNRHLALLQRMAKIDIIIPVVSRTDKYLKYTLTLICPTYIYTTGIQCYVAAGPPASGWQKHTQDTHLREGRYGHIKDGILGIWFLIFLALGAIVYTAAQVVLFRDQSATYRTFLVRIVFTHHRLIPALISKQVLFRISAPKFRHLF